MEGHTDCAHDETIHPLMSSDQLSLFPSDAADASRDSGAGQTSLDERFDRLRPLVEALPATLRMGTSSWSFPGWRGIVYPRAMTATELAREGLHDYARHPLLRTVGVDRTFYAPVDTEDWRRYADQLPDDFVCCIKAPASITSYTVAGERHPIVNPDFMSADRIIEELIAPCLHALGSKAGPIILQFPPMTSRATLDRVAFAEMLDAFLDRLPREAEYAVELRDRTLLTETYRRVVARNGAVHVCNYWSAMPMPGEQADLVEHDRAPVHDGAAADAAGHPVRAAARGDGAVQPYRRTGRAHASGHRRRIATGIGGRPARISAGEQQGRRIIAAHDRGDRPLAAADRFDPVVLS